MERGYTPDCTKIIYRPKRRADFELVSMTPREFVQTVLAPITLEDIMRYCCENRFTNQSGTPFNKIVKVLYMADREGKTLVEEEDGLIGDINLEKGTTDLIVGQGSVWSYSNFPIVPIKAYEKTHGIMTLVYSECLNGRFYLK